MYIREIIENRIQYLQALVSQKKEEMTHLPKGKVRTYERRGKFHYYIRKNEKDSVGEYIRDAHLEEVTKMLQREYDEKVLKQAQRELVCLKRVANFYLKNSFLYNSKCRRK